ncbi:septal ring lytic transglycosylase RlpA family protein [Piscinibacter koreensis]|uniref:Endolytic peptidoglycan transglycosylase RlpA n=1 Tax=Piscinibacter koreensis TaxID=2742824 RepID=A0A7Y6NJF5_9BURK|nr:septal ring lytic transglycosylase RlpA family protein [Schlegelella koreensis]NUZ04272.1 septal ring lytic transglycosylase RlpA family protein [Schlegelella koreensis]
MSSKPRRLPTPAALFLSLAACLAAPLARAGVDISPPSGAGSGEVDPVGFGPPPGTAPAAPAPDTGRAAKPAAATSVDGVAEPPRTQAPRSRFSQRGLASWYGAQFHGRRTASGELYNMHALTAAHPTLPIPSYVRVRNPANGRTIIVRVNDRGPFHGGRILDLSYSAAARLDLRGVASVQIEGITFDEIRNGAWREASADADAATGDGNSPEDFAVLATERLLAGFGDDGERTDATTEPAATPQRDRTRHAAARSAAVRAHRPAGPGASHLAQTASIDARLQVAGAGSEAGTTANAAGGATQVAMAATNPAPAAGPNPAATAVAAQEPIAPTPPRDAAAVRVAAADMQPSGEAAAAREPIATGATATAGTRAGRGFWVELGTFGQRRGAEALQRALDLKAAWLAPLLAVFDESLFKLQAGPFPSRRLALEAAERARAVLRLTPLIVDRR